MSDLIKSKQIQAEQIAKQTAEFLAKGKTIEEYKPSALEIASHRPRSELLRTKKKKGERDKPVGLKELYEIYGIQWLIEQYGHWSNLPANIHLGYPKKSNFTSMSHTSVNMPDIDDTSALIMGDAINELEEIPREIIVMYFIKRKTFDTIAEIFCMSRTRTTEMLGQAMSFLDGYIKMFLKSK